ncbi:MAG TPA: CDP-diacylglycerol--serine O-phosphatidyltransferase [Thermoanaerobaculia bacterium]|nr:CDP-diacylglycerol--serine O-phosphatidyltransferase [Thermoanaerobaculia bacterium]
MTAPEERSARGRLRRGIYLLPSVFTIGNMVLGFYAMVLAMRGDYRPAVLCIFAAAFLDSLDGRLARVTQTASEFGREYDSLADVVTFGVAPAFLVYSWGLYELGRIGWILPVFYLVSTATRLARFNVQTKVLDKRFFVGLPAPAAAGALGSILYFADGRQFAGVETTPQLVLLTGCVVLGLLMVSSFRYYSFKELDPRRRWSFRVALPVAAVLLLILLSPAWFFLTASSAYALSGPVLWLRGLWRRRGDAPGTEERDAGGDEPAELDPAPDQRG